MEKVNSKHYIVMILIYFSIQMVHWEFGEKLEETLEVSESSPTKLYLNSR